MEFSLDQARSTFLNVFLKLKHFQFSGRKQLNFLEDLYTLINDGIPPNRAIEMMAQVTTGITREVTISIAQKVAEGQTLADGMRLWFSPNIVEIIRVGESGGALAQTMQSAISALSQRGIAVGAFIKAVSYPLMVIAMACIIIIYLDSSVFKQFALIKPIEQWPDAGRQLVATSHFIKHWWWTIILMVVLIGIGFMRVMSNYTGDYRTQLDRIPPFNLYRRLVAARFLETLGLLVSNGVVFKSALRVMQYQANPYLSIHLMMMEHILSTGKTNIADVLATGLIDEQDLMRLRIMAEVKGFDHGLVRIGIRGAEAATATLTLIARILGGILLAVGTYLILMILQGIYMTGMSMGANV